MGERKEGGELLRLHGRRQRQTNHRLDTAHAHVHRGSERSDIIQVTSEGLQCMSYQVLEIFAGCNLPMNRVEIREIPSPLFFSSLLTLINAETAGPAV